MWILSYVVDGFQHQFAGSHQVCLDEHARIWKKYRERLIRVVLQEQPAPKDTDTVPAQLFNYSFPVYTHDIIIEHFRVRPESPSVATVPGADAFCAHLKSIQDSRISLRDYFAIHAPEPTDEQIKLEEKRDAAFGASRLMSEIIADLRYVRADRMLARRDRRR